MWWAVFYETNTERTLLQRLLQALQGAPHALLFVAGEDPAEPAELARVVLAAGRDDDVSVVVEESAQLLLPLEGVFLQIRAQVDPREEPRIALAERDLHPRQLLLHQLPHLQNALLQDLDVFLHERLVVQHLPRISSSPPHSQRSSACSRAPRRSGRARSARCADCDSASPARSIGTRRVRDPCWIPTTAQNTRFQTPTMETSSWMGSFSISLANDTNAFSLSAFYESPSEQKEPTAADCGFTESA